MKLCSKTCETNRYQRRGGEEGWEIGRGEEGGRVGGEEERGEVYVAHFYCFPLSLFYRPLNS